MNKTSRALKIVQAYFPEVEKVVDAKTGIRLTVIKADSRKGRKKDPRTCALAQACVRQVNGCTGAIINISTAYIVKGEVATRYKTSESVAREITSFDRHQDFAEGTDYLLSSIPPRNRLGVIRSDNPRGPHTGTGPKPLAVHKHKTSDIRISNH